ncbi:MAG: efflux transporter outer membrane subunit [Verrucomicrobiales bacterium]|nr:efflux transporter outer membrane subunit [Verrucomicrobiales bacterium]
MSKTAAQQTETRTRILDTAELLFSNHGFRDVSLRQITSEANVNIASVNYHFGSKDSLVAEVLTRVIAPINEQRLTLLDEVESRYGERPAPVEEILESIHRPVVNQLKESSHLSSVYLRLAGRCLAEPAENFSETLVDLFQEVVCRFMKAVKHSLPGVDETDLFWRMHFSFGTMVYALTHGDRVTAFSRGRIQSTDPEEILRRLIDFTAAGLKAESKKEQTPTGKTAPASRILLTSAATLLFLSSCKSLSPDDAMHHASVQAPAHWIAGETYRPDTFPDRHWIESFNDSNLTTFVDSVLENNKDLKAAQSRIEIARTTANITAADLYPQLQGSGSGGRSLQNYIGFPIPGTPPGSVLSTRNNQFGLSLDLSWEIDLWGRIRAATKASVADFEASRYDSATAELSLAGQAAKAWFALAEAKDQVALTEATIRTFSGTESLLRDRFESGIEENGRNFASELLLSSADVSRARESLQTQLDLAQRTSRQLEVLAGSYPAGQAGKSARLPDFPAKVPADLPSALLERRPDLAAAERRIAAADERVMEAKKSLLPAIGLTSSFGTTSEDISDILDSGFSVWSVAGNLAQPILQGGRLRANVSRREAELQLAATEFEQAALTAFSEVENALASEEFLTNRVTALIRTARLTSSAYERARDEFETGTGDILTVLAAQQQEFTARSQLLSVRRLRLENRVDLYLALGGSFRAYDPPPLPKETES